MDFNLQHSIIQYNMLDLPNPLPYTVIKNKLAYVSSNNTESSSRSHLIIRRNTLLCSPECFTKRYGMKLNTIKQEEEEMGKG